MLKRIISITLVAVMVIAMATVAVSAAEVSDVSAGADVSNSAGADVSNSAGADTSDSSTGSGKYIYFDASKWKNYNNIYCHIWVRGGADFFPWQGKKERCELVKGSKTKYFYDLSTLELSTDVEGGLKAGTDYCVIFSANTGVQTFDQTFGTACIGDTAKVTGKMIENAVDSEKTAYESVWTTNSSKYGPHLAISSIGNIIGKVLCPNESGAEVIGDWLPTYYNHTNFDVADTLAKALPLFNVKDIQAVYAYILAQKSSDTTFTDADFKTMKSQLEKAYAKAYPSASKLEINDNDAKKNAEKIKKGGSVSDISKDTSGNSGTGSSGSGSSSTNSSGSGADGQNDTILFVLGGVMILAGATMFLSRKKREE